MRLRLDSKVELHEVGAFAELAVWERRPELQRVCEAVRAGGSDEATLKATIPGLTTTGYKNLRRHLEYLQLINANGRLTSFGKHCADSGEAPAWEQGAYYFLVSVHAVFGALVLAFKRPEADGQDRDFDSLRELPDWLRPNSEKVYESLLDSGLRFSITGFPTHGASAAQCRMRSLDPAELAWEIDPETGKNLWSLTGTVGEGRQRFSPLQGSVDSARLSGLIGRWDRRWDQRQGRLILPFDGHVPAGGHEQFLRAQKYPSVAVAEYGTYVDVTVEGVPVGPATDADARAWASAIVVARAEAEGVFATTDKWRSAWDTATAGTPLAGRAGAAPDPRTLDAIGGRKIGSRTRWLIGTTSDIGMEA